MHKAYGYLVKTGDRFLTGEPGTFRWEDTASDNACCFDSFDDAVEAYRLMKKDVREPGFVFEIRVREIPAEPPRPIKPKTEKFDGKVIFWLNDIIRQSGHVPEILIRAGQINLKYVSPKNGTLYIPMTDDFETARSVEVLLISKDGSRHTHVASASVDELAHVARTFMER